MKQFISIYYRSQLQLLTKTEGVYSTTVTFGQTVRNLEIELGNFNSLPMPLA